MGHKRLQRSFEQSIKVLQNMTDTGRQRPGSKACLSYKILILPPQMILSTLQSLFQLFLELFLDLGIFLYKMGCPDPSCSDPDETLTHLGGLRGV